MLFRSMAIGQGSAHGIVDGVFETLDAAHAGGDPQAMVLQLVDLLASKSKASA